VDPGRRRLFTDEVRRDIVIHSVNLESTRQNGELAQIDFAAENLQKVIPIPNGIEVERRSDWHNAIHSASWGRFRLVIHKSRTSTRLR